MSPLVKKASFDASKCVSLLELTIKRIKILKNKRLIIAKQSRDDVAKLLQKGQDANAVARVEHAFREENIAGAYDLLEQYCQLVIKRISAIKSQQECPSEAKEAIDSLIYAAPRCGDLQELQKLRDLVTIKYGADYCAAVLELRPKCSVNQQIIEKLSSRPPSSDTRLKLLKEIAVEYKINWNYQQAVAASFKNEATSKQEKQKLSPSSSQASKEAVSTEVGNGNHSTLDEKELAKSAANNAIPSKPKNADLPKANQAYVVQQPVITETQKLTFDSQDHGRHEHHGRHKSHAARSTSPTTTHSSSPKQKDFVSVSSKKSVVNVDEEKLHGVQVQQASMESPAARGDAALSAMRTGMAQPKDFRDASDRSLHTVANKEIPHSMYMHRDELEGQQSIANPRQKFDPHFEGRGFANSSHMGSVDKVKLASVGMHQDGFVEKKNSVLPSMADMSRPEALVNPVQVPNVGVKSSSERKSLPNGPATSSQDFYEARALSSKLSINSITNYEFDDGNAESLAAKQYMRAHRSYVKADRGGAEDDHLSRPEALLNPMQVGVRNSSERKSEPRRQTVSSQDFYEARALSSKLSIQSVTNYEHDDGTAESLAAKQYMGAHQSYVKAGRGGGEDDYRNTEDSRFNLRTNHGSDTPRVDPYVRVRQEGRMEHRNISPPFEKVKEARRTSRGMYQEEEDTSLYGSKTHQLDPYVKPRQEGRMDHKNISPSYNQVKESRAPQAMYPEEEDASLRPRQDRTRGYKNISKAYEQEQVKESRRPPRLMDQEEEDANRWPKQDRKMDYRNISPAYDQPKEFRRTSRAMDQEDEDASLRSRQDRKMDHRNISPVYQQVKESRRTSRAMAQEEEDTNLYEYYDREQPNGTHHQRGSSSLGHGSASSAREGDWGSEKTFSPQEEHQVEESSVNYRRNPSMLRELSKGRTTRRSVDPEFDRHFADVQAKMESADRAAEAAKAAIDMARMGSMRSRTSKKVGDDKDSLREAHSRPSFKSRNGDVRRSTENVVQGLDDIKDEHEKKYPKHIPRHAEMWRANTDVAGAPPQEQEPDVYDWGTPHFDHFNSYESSEEEPRSYAKVRAHTAKKNGSMTSYHQGRSLASYGYGDDAAPRWDEGPTRDVSKQRWRLTVNEEFVDAEPSLEARMRAFRNEQYSAIGLQEAEGVTGKHYGVSRRSVRSSKPT